MPDLKSFQGSLAADGSDEFHKNSASTGKRGRKGTLRRIPVQRKILETEPLSGGEFAICFRKISVIDGAKKRRTKQIVDVPIGQQKLRRSFIVALDIWKA